jgi:crotonobetainyl-CoA:carnitine CoA-transferase CaiB-like acyl-CoA transferase
MPPTDDPPRTRPALPMDALPALRPGAGDGLLADVVVVDLTTSIAGPYATMLLADLGATVVKVERPGGGDDARAWGPPFLEGQSLWFLSVNRNKRSLALDLVREQGRAVLEDLIARADVFVTNQPPRVQSKLGLDPPAVRRVNPGIVFVSITGFGLDGARADHACYDLIAEGYSGVMDLTGAAGGDPQKVGTPAADMLAGQDAAMAALAALFERQRSGHGRVVDVALVESMTRFLACRIVPFLGSGEVPRRSGGTDSVIAVYQAFDTADEPLTLGLGTDAIWARFWEAVGCPERAAVPGRASNAERRTERARIVDEIQAILRRDTRAAWLARFERARVPAGPINRVDEVTADPELRARGLFYRLEGASPVPQVGLGIRFDGAPPAPRRAPPRLGADADEVLRTLLGYGEERVQRLRADGIIG